MQPDFPVRDLLLSPHVTRALLRKQVLTYGQLREMTEAQLLNLRKIGPKSVEEVTMLLRRHENNPEFRLAGPPSLVRDLIARSADEEVRAALELVDAASEEHPSALHAEGVREYADCLRSVLQQPVSSATIDWGMSDDCITTHVQNELLLFRRVRDGFAVSLRDELVSIVGALTRNTERDTGLVIRYFSIDGKKGETLEDLGNGCNPVVKRERVRQIKEKFEKAAKKTRPPLPVLESIWNTLSTSVRPLAELEWVARAPRWCSIGLPPLVTVFEAISRFGWTPPISVFRSKSVMLVASGSGREAEIEAYASTLQPMIDTLLRDLSDCGAVMLPSNDEPGDVPATLRALASSLPDAELGTGGWLFSRNCPSTRLAKHATGMIESLGALPIETLAEGLQRVFIPGNDRRQIDVPPHDILIEVLTRAGFLVSEESSVVSLPGGARKGRPPATAEAIILEALKAGEPVQTRHELVEAVSLMGLSTATAVLYLGQSALLERVGTGLYSLRGQSVSQDAIEDARERLRGQSATSTRDYYGTRDGRICFQYFVDARRGIGTFSIRPRVVDEGEWTIEREGAPPWTILVKHTYITGLSAAVRQLASEGAKGVEVCFDPSKRNATLKPISE